MGVLALLDSNASTEQLPIPVKTFFASVCAAAFRFILTPIETVSSTLQIEGRKSGMKTLRRKVRVIILRIRSIPRAMADIGHIQIKDRGITVCLWSGALMGATLSFVEHYFVSDSHLSWLAEADFGPSGFRRTTTSERYFPNSIPESWCYRDRRSSGFALPCFPLPCCSPSLPSGSCIFSSTNATPGPSRPPGKSSLQMGRWFCSVGDGRLGSSNVGSRESCSPSSGDCF